MNKISQRTFAKTIAQKMIQDPARRKHWIKMLAAYMVETGIADKVDAVANDVAREIFVQSGELLVRVSSARPLSDATRKQVERIIKEQSGAKDVILDETVDPGLLGGLIARTPDAELDLSVRSKLKQLASI